MGTIAAARRSAQDPTRGALALYALPALGIAAPGFLVQFYLLSFATDALLLAPASIGALLAAGRVWDAVTDPLAGYGSDRTRTRWGRRRPWMAVAAPVGAVAFLALWSPPAALGSPTALTLWLGVWLFVFTAATTAWTIPHQTLAVELSDDPHARTRIFGVRYVVTLSGVALAFGGMQAVGTADDPRAMATALTAAGALAMLVLLPIPALALRERPGPPATPSAPPWRAVRELLANRDTRRLLVVWFGVQLGMSAQGIVAPYMSRYVVERPELMGVMPALFITPLVLSVPLWVRWARRFGRKRVWLASLLGGSVCYALLFGLPPDDFLVTGLLLGSAGFFTGCAGPVGPSLFASLADADARRSGERREGVVFAAKEFMEKASSAAVALLVGVSLQLAGFVPNAPQSETVQLAIRACLGLFPGSMLLVAAALLRNLALDDEASDGATAAARG